MIVVIEAGCAECHGGASEPLVEAHSFESVEAAKEWALTLGWVTYTRFNDTTPRVDWAPHPQGGEHVVVGQGSLWITPMETLLFQTV